MKTAVLPVFCSRPVPSTILASLGYGHSLAMNGPAKKTPAIRLGLDAAHLALNRITALLNECAYGVENAAAKWEIVELVLALRQCAPMAAELDRVLCNLEASAVLLYSAQGHQRFKGGAEGLRRELIECCVNVRKNLPVLATRARF